MKKIILFDVDGTIAESSKNVSTDMINLINSLTHQFEIGIVGGGKFEKIFEQTKGILLDHIFAESGCVYYKREGAEFRQIYTKNLRNHPLYPKIDTIIKLGLHFLSSVHYPLTGHFVDLRNGIIYFSLIGMQANHEERRMFMDLDKKEGIRTRLIHILKKKSMELDLQNDIEILEGGSVGIGIYPKEWDKTQVLESLSTDTYSKIYYFGDKYTPEGNDYALLNHPRVIGYPVDSPNDTFKILEKILKEE